MNKDWGWNDAMCAIWGKAIILGETRAEKEATARLYAAAPNLLNACQVLLSAYEQGERRGGSMDWSDVDQAFEEALTAVTKATSNI